MFIAKKFHCGSKKLFVVRARKKFGATIVTILLVILRVRIVESNFVLWIKCGALLVSLYFYEIQRLLRTTMSRLRKRFGGVSAIVLRKQ